MARLGWDACDVVIVSGDAYVDHPAFGAAVIARVLTDAGYRVGVIAQPRWKDPADFSALGRPRLFFGITAGNVDSMVANLSPNLQCRRTDDYSPGGEPGLRPDRATTVYANLVRRAFPKVPIVIGGIEASMRRLAHYDYWDNAVRRSILLDTRADILVYGMGEGQVTEIARRLASGSSDLKGIPGTAINSGVRPEEPHLVIPSFDDVRTDLDQFSRAFGLWHREADNPSGKVVVQPHGDRFAVQYPPRLLSQAELDHVYDLPYSRQAHPSCRKPVPALDPVRFSITSHRGCLGSCSFCSLSAHQGRIIQWRSERSILAEAGRMTRLAGFKGHITDVGGPSANMYAATCGQMKRGRVCADRECIWPERCPNLQLDMERELNLLQAVRRVPGVKKVSIGTGIRFDLLLSREPKTKAGQQQAKVPPGSGPGLAWLEQVCTHHVSGQLRIAPEHVSDRVLQAMHKGRHSDYLKFRAAFREINRSIGRRQYLIPYFISGHPGATLDDAVVLAEYLVRTERFFIRQVQQFTPLPMTAAGAAYHTGKDPLTDKPLHVARDPKEVRLQRCLLQLQEPKNFIYAERHLRQLGRDDLVRRIRALKPLLGRHLDTGPVSRDIDR